MYKTIQGYSCKPDLPLTKVLKSWTRLTKEIARDWVPNKDVPWWYNERAALSLLSGALWRSHNYGFEEFVDEKRKMTRHSGRLSRKYKGRVDLYLNVQGADFIAECKICWSGASINFDSSQRVEKTLSRACRDIRKTHPKGQRRLGFVFVVPSIKKQYRKELDERLKGWLHKVQSVDCDAMAWVFPDFARRTQSDGKYYPGVVLLAKEI